MGCKAGGEYSRQTLCTPQLVHNVAGHHHLRKSPPCIPPSLTRVWYVRKGGTCLGVGWLTGETRSPAEHASAELRSA